MVTLIHATYIVAHNGSSHCILRDGVVVWEDDRIIHVGDTYSRHVDREIDAEGKLVCPGLINVHALASTSVTILRLDGSMSALDVSRDYAVEGKGSLDLVGEDLMTASRFAWANLLQGGATTSVVITPMAMSRWESPREQSEVLARTAGEMGARAYVSHQFRSAVKYLTAQGEPRYVWDEEAGEAGLRHAIEFCESNEGTYDDRVRTMLFPYQFETCSPALLRAVKGANRAGGYPIHMHVAQSLHEFHESLRRYGKTPVHYLYDIEFLSPSVITTHVLYTSYNPLSGFRRGDASDIEMLAKSGATVAHCPVLYSRGVRGEGMLRSFGVYQSHGVNITLGTDTFPMDMIREMNMAAIMGKMADVDSNAVTARDVFDAATTNAARALGRNDLGKIALGAKADLLIVDMTKLRLSLADDPIKTLVYMGSQGDIDTVLVDGREVVQGGRIPGLDEKHLAQTANALNQKQKRMFAAQHPMENRDDRLFPASYPPWEASA